MRDGTVERFVATRDPELFREIVEEFQERVYRLVAGVLGPWADRDAEEVTQEIFLRVFRKIDQFQGAAAFGTWLYRLAYRQALNHRKVARIRLPHQSERALEVLPAPSSPQRDALASAERRQVAEALEALPDLYRTVLNLYYWQELSVGEIAEALGAPAGTVKSYLFRARQRVRRELERE